MNARDWCSQHYLLGMGGANRQGDAIPKVNSETRCQNLHSDSLECNVSLIIEVIDEVPLITTEYTYM